MYFLKRIKYTSHGLRTPGEEIVFTVRPKIHSHSQIFRYGRNIFCLPYRPKFSDFFDFCLHWVSVVCEPYHACRVSILFWFQKKNINFSLFLPVPRKKKFPVSENRQCFCPQFEYFCPVIFHIWSLAVSMYFCSVC